LSDKTQTQEFFMNKMIKTAIALVAFTSVFSFADENEGGFKVGFYGSLASGGGSSIFGSLAGGNGVISAVGGTNAIGALFNLGNGLELGFGLGISNISVETSGGPTTQEVSFLQWEIIPSASYQLGKKDFVSYGAGLSVHLASYSMDQTSSGTTVTTKPKNMDMGFFPNFYIKADVVKNFCVGLKTGFMINMPGDDEQDGPPNTTTGAATTITTSTSIIDTKTEIFVSFYL